MHRHVLLALLALSAGCALGPAPLVASTPAPVAASPSAGLPSPALTPTPVPTQAIPLARLTHGTLYDEVRQPLKERALVQVRATDPGETFVGSVITSDGRWAIADVPSGKLEVSVTVQDWVVRIRRMEALSFPSAAFSGATDDGTMRVVNFGGPYDPKHEFDQYFYLAPEVPAEASGTDNVWPIITPGATPSCRYAPSLGGTLTILYGKVYDKDGKPFSGPAMVKVEAPQVPYVATTQVVGGEWVVNNVPRGADVTLTATAEGYQPRVRAIGTSWYQPPVAHPYPDCTVSSVGGQNVFNFGGPATAEDPEAAAFALQPAAGPSAPPP